MHKGETFFFSHKEETFADTSGSIDLPLEKNRATGNCLRICCGLYTEQLLCAKTQVCFDSIFSPQGTF